MQFTNLIEVVKKANKPGAPVDAPILRIGLTAALLIGIAAITHEHEISQLPALAAGAAIIIGMVFTYLTRKHPFGYLKILLALLGVFAFYQFITRIFAAASVGNLPSLIAPVAALFVWIQVIHAWDVPALKDLLFSLVGSATFILIAAAQAVDSSFFLYFGIWALVTVFNLIVLWLTQIKVESPGSNFQKNIKYAETPIRATIKAIVAICFGIVVALLAIVIVPAPQPVQSIQLPESLHLRQALATPGALYDGGKLANEPAQPLPPSSRIAIGGFIGFGNQLDTAVRASFSNNLIMRVRTTTPGYFLGMTFGKWDGQSWSQTSDLFKEVGGSSPFYVGNYFPYFNPEGQESIQTYYLAQPLPNLIFAEDTPEEIFFPDFRIFLGQGRTITTGVGMEQGTIYTVISRVVTPTPAQLADVTEINRDPTYGLDKSQISLYTSLPKPYTRVKNLVLKITRGATSVEGKILRIESWLSKNTRYTLNIPPLYRGQDAVDEFLFVTKRGYCEQISTALAVMLRTIGIATREAVGYLPGQFNPLTDLWEVRAKDAHAWVQVWFGPKYGWQNVDPTAVVPLANPNPGGVLLSAIGNKIKRLPYKPLGIIMGIIFLITVSYKIIKMPRKTWAAKQFRKISKLAKNYRIVTDKTETPYSLSNKLVDSLNKEGRTQEAELIKEITEFLLRESYDPKYQLDKALRKKTAKHLNSLL